MVTLAAPARQEIALTRTIQAPISQVYKAFTDRDWIRDWLCDDAHLRAAVGGHLLLTWQGGEHVTGVYTALDKNERAAFTWRGAHDSQDSAVEVRLGEENGGTNLELAVTGFAPDTDLEALQQTWETRLNTLQAALENGEDIRITQRVIIGIYPDDFNAEIAARMGVPVTEGTRVANVIPGYSAEAAGLQANDVVVAMNGQAINADTPIGALVQGKKPGDTVEVTYYRGAEKHSVPVTLKGYPLPESAVDFETLAARLEATYAELHQQLSGLFDDYSEAEVSQKPAPKEWSANEVLAHLLLSERGLQTWMGSLMDDQELNGSWSANNAARIASVLSVYPTTADLLAELRRAYGMTVALVRSVPEEDALKSILWWTNFEMDGMTRHTQQHFDQIRAALAAARGA